MLYVFIPYNNIKLTKTSNSNQSTGYLSQICFNYCIVNTVPVNNTHNVSIQSKYGLFKAHRMNLHVYSSHCLLLVQCTIVVFTMQQLAEITCRLIGIASFDQCPI